MRRGGGCPLSHRLRSRANVAQRAYRRDIDGLRAIAVLAVVLYHVHAGFMRGGFAGVDVFFVLSGFLITGIISSELAEARFSVARFYERRIRRIFPALFTMLAASTLLAAVVLLPAEFVDYAKSLFSTAFFASNYYQLSQLGYFSPGAEVRPLLHTWSLAVEEQFYLVFPLVMIGLARMRRASLPVCLAVLCAASFVLSAVLVVARPSEAFYSALPRAWELLIGSLVAVAPLPALRSAVARDVLAASGLALVAGSLLLLTSTTPFPGAAALAPTIGTALLLYAGMHAPTRTGRMLSHPVAVFFGLISYSLYLWHWPLLVFGRLALGHDLTRLEKCGAVLATIAIATLSWHFVERPWRTRGALIAWPRLAYVTAAAIAVLGLTGGAVAANSGIPARFSERVNRVAAFATYDAAIPYRQDSCFLRVRSNVALDIKRCMTPDPARPNYLLIGDSHAADLWFGLATAFPQIHFMQATATGCKSLLDDRGLSPCRDVLQLALRRDTVALKPAAVLLSSDWNAGDLPSVLATTSELQRRGQRVIVFGQVPNYQIGLPRLLAMSIAEHDATRAERARTADSEAVDRRFARAFAGSGIEYISLYALMCGERRCATATAAGVPLQFDTSHFTAAGSAWIAGRLKASGAAFGSARPLRTARREPVNVLRKIHAGRIPPAPIVVLPALTRGRTDRV